VTENADLRKPLFDEIHALILAAQHDELTQVGAERLDRLVCEDAAARRLYAQYVLETANLRVWAASESEDREDREPHGGDYSVPLVCPAVVAPPRSRPAWDSSLGEWMLSYSVATLFLCAALLGAWFHTISRDYDETLVDDSRGLTTPGESLHDRSALVFVGRVTGMAGARWSDEPNYIAPLGVRVALGRTYKLKSGLLEITYDSGAKVILEGPCSYEVESSSGGYLALGKLVARVGAGDEGRGAGEVASGQWSVASVKNEGGRMKAEGDRPNAASLATSHQPLATNPSPLSPLPSPLFTVRTPTAVVTDLGTEFGVEVDGNGNTISRVFQGVVALWINGDDENRVVLRENETAKAGNFGEAYLSAVVKLSSESSSPFVRSMPSDARTKSADYAEIVLSYRPVVYYRMEQPQPEAEANDLASRFDASPASLVFDSSGGGFHGILNLGNEIGQPYRAGRWGGALWLRGPGIVDAVFVPDYPKAADGKLSFSAWVTAEKWMVRWPKIAANWGNAVKGQFNVGLYEQEQDLVVRVIQRDGTLVTLREGRDFPFSEWQHVAFTIDGNTLRLYRNGEEVARTECNGLIPNPPIPCLVVGGKTEDNGKDILYYYCWRGMIDELALFNSALSAEDIRRLYEARPVASPNSHNRAINRGKPNTIIGDAIRKGGN